MKLNQIERGVFAATVHGKPAIVAFMFRDRSKAEYSNNSVTLPAAHVRHAKAMAAEKKIPCYVGIQVSVKGVFNQSWVIPAELFSKTHIGESDFPLGENKRKEYEADKLTVKNERYEIVKPEPVAETKPAAKPVETKATKPAAKPALKKAA